jgi:hypothetical protein
VTAWCSADGHIWFTAGTVDFPVPDPVEIGLCANAHIDRGVYQGACREGTAIRFESFRIWR